MVMPGVGSVTTVGPVSNTISGGVSNQGNAPFNEMARFGGIWNVSTVTAFAPIVAFPTTVARLEIWNNSNNAGGPAVSFEIIDLYTFQLLGTAASQTYAIWAAVAAEAVPSSTSLVVFNQSGKVSYASGPASRVVTGVGTTMVAGGWRPWGTVQAWGTATATPGNAWVAEVHGKLLVPPGSALHIQVVGAIATASSFQTLGASWAEVIQTNV